MDDERSRVRDRCRDQQGRVERMLRDLSDDEVRRRPAPERWSLGEHLEHLALTAETYVDALHAAVEHGRARGLVGTSPCRRGPIGSLAVRAMEPPVRLRLRAPRIVRPRFDRSRDEVADRFGTAHDAFVAFLEQADDVDLGRVMVRSPLAPLLRFRALQACELVVAHVERHLWLASTTGAEPAALS